jgi:hypothetical protein
VSAAAAPAGALPRSVAARTLNLLPPTVVTGAVRVIEFLLVAALGFAIYLGYVESEEQSAHQLFRGGGDGGGRQHADAPGLRSL